jgi:hypothetical protein
MHYAGDTMTQSAHKNQHKGAGSQACMEPVRLFVSFLLMLPYLSCFSDTQKAWALPNMHGQLLTVNLPTDYQVFRLYTWENPNHGIVDISFGMRQPDSKTVIQSDWATHSHKEGWQNSSVSIPAQATCTGIEVREQDYYGIVNARLQYVLNGVTNYTPWSSKNHHFTNSGFVALAGHPASFDVRDQGQYGLVNFRLRSSTVKRSAPRVLKKGASPPPCCCN